MIWGVPRRLSTWIASYKPTFYEQIAGVNTFLSFSYLTTRELRGKLSFPQLWSEQNHEDQREKVDTGCKHEEAAVAVCSL